MQEDFERVTVDRIKSGDCKGWLRVEIYQLELREGVNGDYLRVVYHSLADCSKKWKFSQNYFGIGEDNNKRTNSLGQVTGLHQLHHYNMHELVGKQLEVRLGVVCKQSWEFCNVYNHRRLTEGRTIPKKGVAAV